jgi:integrase
LNPRDLYGERIIREALEQRFNFLRRDDDRSLIRRRSVGAQSGRLTTLALAEAVGKPSFPQLAPWLRSPVIAGGADQGHVARLLRHTDPGFTYRTYVHQFDQQAKQQALGIAFQGVL